MAVIPQIGAGFNIGTDSSIIIADDYGDVFPAEALSHLMEVDYESEDVELKIIPITGGGVPIYMTIWAGIRGHLLFTRVSGGMQAMIASLMDAYFTNGTVPFFTLTQTVLNRDGSMDSYLLTGGQWSRPRFGNYRATKEVDMRLEFRASQMTLTGGVSPFLNIAA
jgi:hypothetical protein